MELYDFERFNSDSLNMWYKGQITDDITENLIDVAGSDIKGSGLGRSRKKVSFLMAESFQNIVRHGLEDQETRAVSGSFGITKRNDEVHIFSANLIPKDQGLHLKEKLNQVNDLEKEELDIAYRKILAEGEMSEKGGAGLGLIEMARKSGKPLQYAFKPAADKIEFCMQIDRDVNAENTETNMFIEESKDIHKYFQDKGIVLFLKGDFDSETTGNMVRMLGENTDIEHNRTLQRAIFHAGVELLQNMSRHGSTITGSKEGVFIMAIHNNEVVLTTRNFVDHSHRDAFEQHLEEINQKTREELTDWYQSKLKESMLKDELNAGIGLIEIARRISSGIKYSFESSLKGLEGTLQVRIKIEG